MTIYRQFRVTYRKRLLVYSLLCVALATGNALFWLHKWHEQGVELCFADTMMTGVQPSFLLMLLIPPTLGLVHQLKFILEQPFVICALDNRARLARNLLAALLFIAFRAVMAVSIPSIALGALLFRGGKPCTWESGASYYSIPCQIDLRCFGKIVALPKFKVHIMPDKTHGMVIHEQICINLLVTVLAKGAALGKVGMLIEIFQNSRIVDTAGGFFRQ